MIINKNLTTYCLSLYSLDPFECVWEADTEYRKAIFNKLKLNCLLKKQSRDFRILSCSIFKGIADIVQVHFQNNPNKEWFHVVNLKDKCGDVSPFLLSFVPYRQNDSGGPSLIALNFYEILIDNENIKDLEGVVFKYHENKYKELLELLTETEYKVFVELVRGKSVNQIAKKFFRSKYTIESHSSSIKKKLKCKNLYELIILGYKVGLNNYKNG